MGQALILEQEKIIILEALVNRKQKEELVERLHKTFLGSSSVIVTHINGLTVAESTALRMIMREANCKFKVTKNRIVKLALKKTQYEYLEDLFKGPTAIGSSEDTISPAKVLVKFSKESEKMKIIGGGFSSKPLSVEEIKSLASLPSLDEIRSKLIGLINASSVKIIRTLLEPPTRVARIISTKNS